MDNAYEPVTVRRYIQPGLTPGHPDRQLKHEHHGVIISTDRYGITLDCEPGYIGTGYVFLGGENKGTGGQCYYLVTEVIPGAAAS